MPKIYASQKLVESFVKLYKKKISYLVLEMHADIHISLKLMFVVLAETLGFQSFHLSEVTSDRTTITAANIFLWKIDIVKKNIFCWKKKHQMNPNYN